MDTQSVHAVIYNDDLLIEILLLLPVISLLQLKSVCKRWLSLISDPTFTLRRSQTPILDPPCRLLVQSFTISSGKYDLLSFDTRIPCKRSKLENLFTFGRTELHNAEILQSCNGLLLLRYSNSNANKYCVYNPCINLLKKVPHCSNKTIYWTNLKLAFDPTKSPHYKVIHAEHVDDADDDGNIYSVEIQTYSSETGTWSVYTGRYPHNSFCYYGYGIYWNDALYWLNWDDHLLFKLDINVEHQTLTTIKIPETCLDGELYRGFQLFETCGCLLLLCRKNGNPLLMDVYERRKGYSEWLVKYRANLNDDVSCPRRSWMYPIVDNIFLGEREEDSFIVIKDHKKIYHYKPLLKTSHDLSDMDLVQQFSFQFIASFAGVGL